MSTGAPASDDSDMEPQPASDPEQYAHCTLCEFTGGENYKFQEILCFVADHCHEVHIDGLCAQVKTSLETEFQMTLSHAEIKNHFLHHQCDQKIVLNNILRELVPLVGGGHAEHVTHDASSHPGPTALYRPESHAQSSTHVTRAIPMCS